MEQEIYYASIRRTKWNCVAEAETKCYPGFGEAKHKFNISRRGTTARGASCVKTV